MALPRSMWHLVGSGFVQCLGWCPASWGVCRGDSGSECAGNVMGECLSWFPRILKHRAFPQMQVLLSEALSVWITLWASVCSDSNAF